jgi:NAD(P)-dependent dehydrogenase (short-subunit alcohol dehydrogenase family)
MKLQGRTAIITGGAGGIGQSVSRLFAAEGAQVAIADLLDQEGAQLEAELNHAGRKAFYQRTDVSDAGQVQALVQRTVEELGPPDILVTLAGWLRVAMAIHVEEADFDRTIASHIKGTWLLAKHSLPHMMQAGGGAIVTISSMQAYGAIPGRIAYEAAKGGISAMTRALALEYGPANVRVNAICPGIIITPRNEAKHGTDFTPDEVKARIESYPLRRLGRPQDVAKAALFLASDDASWITGTDVFVDGGHSIQLAEAVHFPPFRRLWQEAVPQA